MHSMNCNNATFLQFKSNPITQKDRMFGDVGGGVPFVPIELIENRHSLLLINS